MDTSENPKMVMIPVTLKGPNYLTWARLAKTALGGRGLWEIVEEGRPTRKTVLGEDGKEVVVADAGDKKKGQEDLMVLSISKRLMHFVKLLRSCGTLSRRCMPTNPTSARCMK